MLSTYELKLTRNSCGNIITSKANHCRLFLQQETKLRCYKTLDCPIFKYGSSFWDPAGNNQLQYQLEQMQRKTARWSEFKWEYKSSASNMVENLGHQKRHYMPQKPTAFLLSLWQQNNATVYQLKPFMFAYVNFNNVFSECLMTIMQNNCSLSLGYI